MHKHIIFVNYLWLISDKWILHLLGDVIDDLMIIVKWTCEFSDYYGSCEFNDYYGACELRIWCELNLWVHRLLWNESASSTICECCEIFCAALHQVCHALT